MSKITLQIPEKTEPTVVDYMIHGNAFSVKIEDTVYEGTLVITGVGEGWLNHSGKILPFYMTQKNELLNIWVDSRTYSIQLVTAVSRRRHDGSGVEEGGEVKSPMPGTILKVPVKTGDRVKANQPLIIMESMKMEMTLSALQAATVKEVYCSEGQMVEMGVVLVQLEESE